MLPSSWLVMETDGPRSTALEKLFEVILFEGTLYQTKPLIPSKGL